MGSFKEKGGVSYFLLSLTLLLNNCGMCSRNDCSPRREIDFVMVRIGCLLKMRSYMFFFDRCLCLCEKHYLCSWAHLTWCTDKCDDFDSPSY